MPSPQDANRNHSMDEEYGCLPSGTCIHVIGYDPDEGGDQYCGMMCSPHEQFCKSCLQGARRGVGMF